MELEEGGEEIIVPGTELTPTNVTDMRFAVDLQNAELINKLALVQRAPNPIAILQNKLEVLIDFMFNGEEDAYDAFKTACAIRFNQQLKEVLGEVTSSLTLQ